MINTIRIESRYLITSFITDADILLATFDNVSGRYYMEINSFFHIEVNSQFYLFFENYSFVQLNYDRSVSMHPSIHLMVFKPMPDYSNQKMENMFCDVLKYYYMMQLD